MVPTSYTILAKNSAGIAMGYATVIVSNTTITLKNDGTDWGARINAADTRLGSQSGIIDVQGGGHIDTQVVLGSGHTLQFGAGTWTNTNKNETFLLKDNTVLTGHLDANGNPDSIIMEPPDYPGVYDALSYEIVAASFAGKPDQSAQMNNINVSNIKFSGEGIVKPATGITSTLGLSLLNGGTFSNITFYKTHGIGMTIGGINIHGGVFARNILVQNCTFINVGGGRPGVPGGGGVSLAIINGKDVTVTHNFFHDASGNAVIDVEPNVANDDITNVIISNNTILQDGATGNGLMYVFGIVLHGGVTNFGPVYITGNTVTGAFYLDSNSHEYYNGGNIFNAIDTGYGSDTGVETPNVHVLNNTIKYTGNNGIRLASINSECRDNHIWMPGSNLQVVGSHNVIDGNYVASNHYYFGIEELPPSDYNAITNNQATGIAFVNGRFHPEWNPPAQSVYLVGPHSTQSGNVLIPRPPFAP